MLSCDGSHESPWFVVRGSEHCAKVKGVAEGDVVALEIEHQGATHQVINLESGPNPIELPKGRRFKIRKITGPRPVATTVEIFY